MDYLFGQVSHALEGGSTEPEAFTLVLRFLSNHFDRTDTMASYLSCIISACLTGSLFAIFAGTPWGGVGNDKT